MASEIEAQIRAKLLPVKAAGGKAEAVEEALEEAEV
jgi:hypothetical protein